MSRFPEFSRNVFLAEEEAATLAFWREENIFARQIEERIAAGAPRFVFNEGPPTANGRPGIHHVLGRTIKDLVCRYHAMNGKLVERKSGWDTHGLPVELEVEKKLGIQGKEQIEAYGLEKFNALCRESVFTYKDEWERLTERIGFWLDIAHPYVTLENDYIESVWWVLRQFWDKGLVYEGFKILPYCPRCETPLSSHEVSQGYAEAEDPSVFVKFRSRDDANLYYLAWTTTPWTLVSNVALAVHPDEPYVRVRLLPRHDKDGNEKADAGHAAGQELILAKARLSVLYGPHEVLDEFPGRAMAENQYEPLFPYFSDAKNAFRVLTANYVSMGDGTGIVHTAPAFGEDDYQLGRAHDLPMPRPVNRRGEFTDDIAGFAGTFVKAADPGLIDRLRESGALYTAGTMTHSYPFCWRCDSPLIYYARDSWYLKTTAFRDAMVAANAGVRWVPAEAGEKRFGDWLRNNIDWAISRDRYWGTPLPVWRCDACGTTDLVPGRRALKERGADVPDDLDLHRPYIDRITFGCAKATCSGTMRRVPEVVDVWFDSGAMPFAQWHYPFENEARFAAMFPADFISEGIDQSRGWFYSLLAISVCVTGKSPYRSVVVNDHVLDAEGQKMSKHKGNTVNPWELLEKEGADAVRWYLMVNSPPWVPTRFDRAGVVEVARKFLGTLRNVAGFFAMYANIDGWGPGAGLPPALPNRPPIDRWLLSRLDGLVAAVDRHMAEYDMTRAARALQEFVLEDVSNWYVRRNRRRFWKGEVGPDKEAAYATLHETLATLSTLVAPIVPFVAEELHQKIVRPAGPKAPVSVHLAAWPSAPAASSRRDSDLEAAMDAAMRIVEAGRAARNLASLKVRQPLPRLLVATAGADPAMARALTELTDLILDELNVKAIEAAPAAGLFRLELKPNFKALGPIFGKEVNRAAEAVRNLPPEAAARLARGEPATLSLGGHDHELTAAHVDIVRHAAEGLAVAEAGGIQVGLDTTVTPALAAEGLVRELVHRLQNHRKESGLSPTDRIYVEYWAIQTLRDAIDAHAGLVRAETLAVALEYVNESTPLGADWDVDGHRFKVSIRPAE
jgi:isoleucyl-tRNA synthetase